MYFTTLLIDIILRTKWLIIDGYLYNYLYIIRKTSYEQKITMEEWQPGTHQWGDKKFVFRPRSQPGL